MIDPVPVPEQQGEPVCARCGHDRTVWQHHSTPLREMMAAYEIHPFEPHAPPSSEEAEARWWVDSWCAKHNGHHLQHGEDGSRIVVVDYESGEMVCQLLNEAASLAPLEERVRELERTVAELDADREPLKERAVETYNMMVALEVERDRALKLRDAFREVSIDLNREKEHERAKWLEEVERRADAEEERDRLREELRIALANQDTLAQVVDMDGPLDRAVARAEAAEAQVAKLREALEQIGRVANRWGGVAMHEAQTMVEAVLAETVQEGGETQ